jgi:hypothetical protein
VRVLRCPRSRRCRGAWLTAVRCAGCFGMCGHARWRRRFPGGRRAVPGGSLITRGFTGLRLQCRGPGGACALRADAGSGSCREVPRWRRWSVEGTPAVGAVCSRECCPAIRAVARAAARQSPGRRGNLPGTGSPATGRPVPGQPDHPARAGLPRGRSAENKNGQLFATFSPAIGPDALKAKGQQVRD